MIVCIVIYVSYLYAELILKDKKMKKVLWIIVLVLAVGGLWYTFQDKTPAVEPVVEEVDTLTISEKTELAEITPDSLTQSADSVVVAE